ncbi:hypothetical protein B0H14DRAFT_2644454 [Mycena olivaceomarginata]|nr:hypothetical protein B0H14DRAFT_2644454 [Mycena olivaceomarginata]
MYVLAGVTGCMEGEIVKGWMESAAVVPLSALGAICTGISGLFLCQPVISGLRGKKEEKRYKEILEEGCPIPEVDGVTRGTELDIGIDSQCRMINWVPGILDPKLQISKTQHH